MLKNALACFFAMQRRFAITYHDVTRGDSETAGDRLCQPAHFPPGHSRTEFSIKKPAWQSKGVPALLRFISRAALLLPLLAFSPPQSAQAQAQSNTSGICGRTQQVQDAIIAKVSGKSSCGDITTEDLTDITGTLAVTDDTSFTTLKAGDFDNLTKVTKLDLNRNGLSGQLPAGVFDDLTSLRELWLIGSGVNGLSSLPAGVFDKLTNLTLLEMPVHSLSSLPAGVFDKLTNLKWLGLGANDLTNLRAGVFDKLTNLTRLRLYSNKLTNLRAGVFDKLTSLRYLTVSANELTSLPAGVFDKLTSLTDLDLRNNYSLGSGLPAGVFDKLTNLTDLGLGRIGLSSLPEGIYKLTKLEYLSLYGNRQLSSLPPTDFTDLFAKLTSLDSLDLSGIGLSSLPEGIDKLTSLRWLYLEYNGLSSLPAGVFDKLTSLYWLSLDYNTKLTCLPAIPTSVRFLFLEKKRETYAACGAGVTVSKSSLKVETSGSAVYTVVLDAAPNTHGAAGDVTVTPASSDAATATVSGPLTFTSTNWDTPQAVTVSGKAVGTATIAHTVAGGGYGSATAASVTVQAAPTVPPVPVTNIAVTHNGSNLTVTWDAPEGATHYDVTYYRHDTGVNARGAWNRAGTSLTITCDVRTGYEGQNCVDSGTAYTVGVRARNAAGASAWRNSASASLAAPGPVTNIQVAHQGTSLAVSWDAPSGATHYDVTYYRHDTGVNARGAWNRAGTSLTITRDSRDGYDNSINSNATYTVGVRARNAAGESAWRNSASASLAAPGPVTNIQVAHQGTSLAVSWDAPSGATHYDVTYYRHDTGVNARGAWNRAGTSLTITRDSRDGYDNSINSNATYTVGVRARNAAGESAWANSAAVSAPALSVADTSVSEPSEGLSASLDFVVTLAPAASWTVTVDYATGGGTATAGSDYTSTSGTLTFAAGETSKTVSVPVLADSHDDGGETLTLTLSNPTGARISDGEATGAITNDGPIPKAWNARFGRTVADQVLEGVETRLRSAPAPGVDVYLAGERLEWPDASDGTHPVAQQVADQVAQWLVVGSGDNGDAAVLTVNGDDLLSSSSFALASPTSGGGLLSFWGRGAITNFDGRDGELSLDGQVTTVMLGTDWSWGQWPDGGQARRSIAGLLLSRSTADGGYTGSDAGEVDATLTGVFPWIGHRFSHQLEAWGAAGYGQGELEVTPKPKDTDKNGATLTADLNLWLAASGLRGTLVDGGSEGLTLTGKGDALVVGTSSGETRGMKAAEATVTRLRLGLEAHRPFPLGNPELVSGAGSGATLTPSLELGLRHDGGDAETGFGLDLGGGIVLSHPERGLQAELRGRGLLSHAAEGFRDRGFSGSLSWQQRPDSDLGAALSLSQTMGGLSSGGADALLSRTTLEGLAANAGDGNDDLNNQRLELQLSYGLPAFGDRFTLTPELGLGFYDSGRDYRLGWSLTQPDGGESFAFSFDVTRRDSANNDGAPEHGVELRLDTLF